MQALKWGLPYVIKHKWRYILCQIIGLINIALSLVNPFIAGQIVLTVIEEEQYERLPMYLGIMVGVTLYRTVTRYLSVMLYETTSQQVLYELRRDLYHKLHIQTFSWFDKNRVGDIMSRMTGDLDAIRHFIAWTIYQMVDSVLLYIAAIIVMFTINIPLTLAMMATTPVLVYAARKQSKALRPAFRNVREQFSNLNATCGENIGGNRVVKAFTKEPYEIEKFQEANQAFYNANLTAAKVRVKYFPVMETCASLLPWILLLLGGLLVIWDYIELWEMVTVSGYLWMLNNPIRMLNMCVNDTQNAATSLDKVWEMMRQEIPIQDGAPPNPDNPRIAGDIEFRNVSFKYDLEGQGPLVLNNISFRAKRGQTIGIVGKTGSGKTTLTYLISRFYDVTGGEVMVDGKNVKDYALADLRRGISYAMQDVFLYSDSVEGNIAFGVPDAPDEAIYSAAHIADAHEFVAAMPDSYETVVGERGVGLSGGQKQRISLARAIAADPSVLILDDVTSAVDIETEGRIQDALRDNNTGSHRTTFIVAHRLSSVKDADLILVLEGGIISERGTHAELMRLGGYYAKLYDEQKGVGFHATQA